MTQTAGRKSADFDLVITNGLVVDGSGGDPFEGGVGIQGDRIVAVGNVEGSAARTIDAEGHVISPGFVDIHTHYDVQIFWDSMLSVSPWHGVTTVVSTNCGFGIAPAKAEHHEILLRTLEQVEGMPYATTTAGIGEKWPYVSFPEYLDAVERCGMAINMGFLIGHTPVRFYTMGDEALDREATAEEIVAMQEIVRGAMQAGALGFSTSNHRAHVGYLGRPVPSRLASLEEIIALVQAMGSVGKQGVFATNHGPVMSNKGMRAVMDATGCRLNWSGIFADEGPTQGGKNAHYEFFNWLDELSGEGDDFLVQVSPRPFTIQASMERPFMFAHDACEVLHIQPLNELFDPVSAMNKQEMLVHYQKRGFAERFAELTSSDGWMQQWSRMTVDDVEGHPELTSLSVKELADKWGVHPSMVMLRLSIDSGLQAKFGVSYLNVDETEVERLLTDPRTRLGLTDAGAHVGDICDACYPTYLLQHWVRDKGVLSLPQAVHMLTARNAEVYHFDDRGLLRAGMKGDVVVFDPDTVAPGPRRRVADLPAGGSRLVVDAVGMDHVIVNGTPILENGAAVVDTSGPLPGRLLRS